MTTCQRCEAVLSPGQRVCRICGAVARSSLQSQSEIDLDLTIDRSRLSEPEQQFGAPSTSSTPEVLPLLKASGNFMNSQNAGELHGNVAGLPEMQADLPSEVAQLPTSTMYGGCTDRQHMVTGGTPKSAKATRKSAKSVSAVLSIAGAVSIIVGIHFATITRIYIFTGQTTQPYIGIGVILILGGVALLIGAKVAAKQQSGR